MVLQRLLHLVAAFVARLEDDEGLDDRAALLVGPADYAALRDRDVLQQRRLDFRAGDVVAGGDDHVVGARLVEEVAVLVAQIGVAGEVPAVLYIVFLPLVRQVAAAGRALDREAADRARLAGPAFLVEDRRLVARNGVARGTAAHAL